jgi:hypothetical protein
VLFSNDKHLLPTRVCFLLFGLQLDTHTRWCLAVLYCSIQNQCVCVCTPSRCFAGGRNTICRAATTVTQLVVKFLLFILRPLFALPAAIVHVHLPLSNNPLRLQRESAMGRARGRVAQAKVARSATASAALLPLACLPGANLLKFNPWQLDIAQIFHFWCHRSNSAIGLFAMASVH